MENRHALGGAVDPDDGYLYLDRTSDMIISGGYNVYPREVEDVLMAHPAVLECAVVGAPHEKCVEAVTAFVVLRSGHAVSEEKLIAMIFIWRNCWSLLLWPSHSSRPVSCSAAI